MARYSLDQSNLILPLVKAIAHEFIERRGQHRQLTRLRKELENSSTPEGLGQSLANLDAMIFEHSTAISQSNGELEALGLTILRRQPLTVHFPGRTRSGKVVFCWQEGEESLCHGHAIGEEEEPRRPLKVRIVDTHKA